jgi:predicted dinucleotide-binding enzyme
MPLIEKLCIVGVGLIGGSLGKAAREGRVASRVVGLVRRREAVGECLEAGAVDHATLDAAEAVEGADCAVIATPVGGIEGVAKMLKRLAGPSAVVTDTGSTKAEVVERGGAGKADGAAKRADEEKAPETIQHGDSLASRARRMRTPPPTWALPPSLLSWAVGLSGSPLGGGGG